jgi:general secretion pathway protein L
VFLPQAVAENLAQVLDYEVGRLLPFRKDDVYFDYLVGGKKGDNLGIMIFAVPRTIVDEALAVLNLFGVKPRAVETSATAVANYLLFCDDETAATSFFLGAQNGNWDIVGLDFYPQGWKGKRPEMVFAYSVAAAGWARGPAMELVHNLDLEHAKLFTWAGSRDFLASVTGTSIAASDLGALGRERLRCEFQVAEPMLIPALGAALRGVRESRLSVNLLPEEVREAENKGLSRFNILLVGFLLLALIGLGGSYPIKDELRLRQLQAESRKFAPAVEALRQKEEELTRGQKDLTLLVSLRNQRGEILQVLDELSRIVPNTAYLSNLRYREGGIELQGNAENASTLVPVLERSTVFKNVGFNAPSNRGRDNRETFSLKAEVERAVSGDRKP